MVAEQGKPRKEAEAEVTYAASFVEWFSEEARRTYGEVIPSHDGDSRMFALRQPVGVVAAICPWNFPCAMVTRKAAAAMAAGCCVVVKPSEETPLSALALAALAERAGVPGGVLNVITGADADAVVGALADSKDVRALSFTGSTDVGEIVGARCAKTVKKTPPSSAGTRRSWSSRTRTSTPRSRALCAASSVTAGRRACARRGSSCTRAWRIDSPRGWRIAPSG